ncbi:MAG: hypothetical protein HY290_09930 [Planctomycetia bacterium]|nr:hypothetical protein [Planctomycetia bacterium]
MPPTIYTYQVEASSYRVTAKRYDAKKGAPELRGIKLFGLKQILTGGPALHLNLTSAVKISFADRKLRRFGEFNLEGTINANAVLSDFEDMYRIVHLEKPVYFLWTEVEAGITGDTEMRRIDSYELRAVRKP